MSRVFTILVGFIVLVCTGMVHGLWTDRWHQSEDLSRAVKQLATLPDDLGAWKGTAYEQDPAALALTGAIGHYSRSFVDPHSGENVLVILLVGKPARMAVHRPEHCYQAAGYGMNGPAVKAEVRVDYIQPAEFFTGLFSREEVSGPSQLRIFWSFSSGGRWEAPTSPRTHFARQQVLFKLYVIRTVAGSPGLLNDDSGTQLLGQLLPVLQQVLGEGT